MPVDNLSLHKWLFSTSERQNQLPIFDAAGKAQIATVPIVNPKNPSAGVHVDSHQCYSSCLIQFALYVKNTFDDRGKPKSVKVCLKLLFSPRLPEGGYTPLNDRAKVLGFELSLNEIIPIIQVLNGGRDSFSFRLARPNMPPKDFQIHSQPDPRYPFFVQAAGEGKEFRTGIELKDALMASDMGLSVYQTLNPYNLNPLQSLLSLAGNDVMHKVSQPHTSVSNPNDVTLGSAESQPSDLEAEDRLVTENQKKALWAIYYTRWAEKDSSTIEWIIENNTFTSADAIIRKANDGDLSYFDMCYSQSKRGHSTGSGS